jgi:ABC-type sugar transport system, periplasmic component
VQSAIDSKVNGIALTLAKPDAMAPAVKAALDAGIPVVAFNSGFDNFMAMGVRSTSVRTKSSPGSPPANASTRTAPRR